MVFNTAAEACSVTADAGQGSAHGPRIHTAVPLGASPKAVAHPSEFGSDSDDDESSGVSALGHAG